MLILHRRINEAFCIDGGIRVVVLQSDGGGARLGIEAPDHIGILREEILVAVEAENVRASQQTADGMDVETLDELLPPKSPRGPN